MNKDASKKKTNSPKKNLIRTQKEITRNRIIITLVLLIIAALAVYFIDSGSYVATVDGNRISKAEFMFFLEQQMIATENEEGLSTQDEIDAFWTTPADGQDPFETAKREALNYSKEFMVQYLKAQESGLRITADIKEKAATQINGIRQNYGITEKQFVEQYKISSKNMQTLYEKIYLIEDYKSQCIEKDFSIPDFTDEELKANYEEYKNVYDEVDLTYITLYKFDEAGLTLSDEAVAEKMKTAQEALKKIQDGQDIATLVDQYTEEDSSEAGVDSSRQIGQATISYSQDSVNEYFMDWSLVKWAFDNKIGDVDIIESTYFIYVAQIDGRTSFDDVKENVRTTMSINASEEFYISAIESWGLESRYNIIKNDGVYDSISYK